MTIQKIGALITMTMPSEDQIDAARFEQREEVRAQCDLRRVEIRVVRTATVRGMMPIRDQPLVCIGIEVAHEPTKHRAIGRKVPWRQECHEMNVPIIERVVEFVSRG